MFKYRKHKLRLHEHINTTQLKRWLRSRSSVKNIIASTARVHQQETIQSAYETSVPTSTARRFSLLFLRAGPASESAESAIIRPPAARKQMKAIAPILSAKLSSQGLPVHLDSWCKSLPNATNDSRAFNSAPLGRFRCGGSL